MNNLDDNHQFIKTYYYILCFTLGVLLYVFLITFLPIPEKNQRFVDIALAFLLGQISAISGYLIGGNPQQSRKPPTPTTPANNSQVADTIINTENPVA